MRKKSGSPPLRGIMKANAWWRSAMFGWLRVALKRVFGKGDVSRASIDCLGELPNFEAIKAATNHKAKRDRNAVI